MSKIKNFKDYINENDKWDSLEEWDNFISDFEKALKKFGRQWSYTSMAGHNANFSADVEKFSEILDIMGWNKERVKNLKETLEEDLTSTSMVSEPPVLCGIADAYWFSLDENYMLAGFGVENVDATDYLIKFSYGWHRHSYGIQWLKQNELTTDEFTQKVPEKLKEFFTENNIETVDIHINKNDEITIEFSSEKEAKKANSYIDQCMLEGEVTGVYLNIKGPLQH